MIANQSNTSDALSFKSLFNNVDYLSDQNFNKSLDSSADNLLESLQPLSSVNQALSTSSLNEPILSSNIIASETETNTKLGFLAIADAPVNDVFLFENNQPSLGNLAPDATQILGGLYDDPIEYGTPIDDSYYWRHQQGDNSCAVVAQICVYESLTGEYISEDAASYYAQQQGWFDPLTGTSPENTGNILNALGINTYQVDASLSGLEYALAWGDKPIVGLDASEIWNPQYDLYGNPVEQDFQGHAVWVTGIDYESDGSVGIILNDSGTSSGMASVVGYSDFMNAWQDTNYFVAVADNPMT